MSRTPICLDTVCCRLDNKSISLGETGARDLSEGRWGASGRHGPTEQLGHAGVPHRAGANPTFV